MDLFTVLGLIYFIIIIILVEYIYWYKYLPNMRRLAQNNYEDL